MANAKRLPSGSWRVRVFSHYEIRDGKKKAVYRSFTSKKGKREAERMAAEWSYKRLAVDSRDDIYTMVKMYVQARKGVLSPSTLVGYYSALNQHIKDIGAARVADIDSSAIQEWVSEMSAKLSPKTVANVVGLLQAAYKDKTGRELRLTMPQRKRPELHTPSDDEVRKLLDHVKGKELETAILLAAFCSLRRGEICALDYSDFRDGMVIVNKSMVHTPDGTWEIKAPKTTESIRAVPLPDKLWDMVKDRKGRVVSCTPDNLTNRFRRAIRFSHSTPFRFHDLRHYYASMAHYIGIPDAYIMANGGWKTDSVMKRVYREAMEDKKKEENEKIAQHFNKVV